MRVHWHAEQVITPGQIHGLVVDQHLHHVYQVVSPTGGVHSHLLHTGKLGISCEELKALHRLVSAFHHVLVLNAPLEREE